MLSLNNLKLPRSELETLAGISLHEWSIGFRLERSLLRHPQKLLSFFVSECIVFGVIVILTVPICLLVARSLNLLNNTPENTLAFLQYSIGIAGAIALLGNAYFLYRAKQFTLLWNILDDVNAFHELLDTVYVLDQLQSVQPTTALHNREDILTALNATRESLVCAMMTERILRRHQSLLARRYDLLNSLERNLTTLQSLAVQQSAHDYSQILNDALQISLSVRQELSQWQHLTPSEPPTMPPDNPEH
jgi:hypothetical protein